MLGVKNKLFMDSKTLNRWKKVQGLFILSGYQAQVLCRSLGVIQHIWLARPAQINEYDGVVILSFAINEHIRAEQIKKKITVSPYIWKAATYLRKHAACVLDFEPEESRLIDSLPNIRYLNFDERMAVEDRMRAADKERVKRAV